MGMDYGAANGLAQGLLSGIQGYREEKDRQFKVKQYQDTLDAQKLARDQQAQNMQFQQQSEMLQRGQQKNTGTGLLEETPEQEKKGRLGLLKLQGEADMFDPNSARAKAASGFLARQGTSGSEGMPLQDIEKIASPLALSNSKERITAKGDTEKATKNQNQAMQNVSQMLESAKGNPAVGQAEKDLYSAKKAQSLFERYKDPNQMSSPEIQLYATEIAKMASGGVPSIHELQGLNPSTIPKSLAEAAQLFSNKPEPAKAAEFLKRFNEYGKLLQNDAQAVIEDKYGRVIDANRDRLGEKNYGALQSNYINRFNKGLLNPETQNSGYPKQVKKGNQMATVTNAQEEKEANSEGFQ